MAELLDLEQVFTSPQNPQENGLVERVNKTVTTLLEKRAAGDFNNWDRHLPYAMFAYNTTPSSVTGFSPFEMLYGREARLPGDPIEHENEAGVVEQLLELRDEEGQTAENVDALRRKLAVVYEIARRRTRARRLAETEDFDSRHLSPEDKALVRRYAIELAKQTKSKSDIEPGDWVLMYKKRRKEVEHQYKSKYYWAGPYEVEKVNKKTVRLAGDEKWLERVSRRRLKKFTIDVVSHFKRDEDPPELTEDEKEAIEKEQEEEWRLRPQRQRLEERISQRKAEVDELDAVKKKNLELKKQIEEEQQKANEEKLALAREKTKLLEERRRLLHEKNEELLRRGFEELEKEAEKHQEKMKRRVEKGWKPALKRSKRDRKRNQKYLSDDFE